MNLEPHISEIIIIEYALMSMYVSCNNHLKKSDSKLRHKYSAVFSLQLVDLILFFSFTHLIKIR